MHVSLRSLLIIGTVLVAACNDSVAPTPSLEGHWLITAYENNGVIATAVAGTADFAAAGTVDFDALITFPGEPQDTIDVTLDWGQTGSRLLMADSANLSEWSLAFGADAATVVLTLLNSSPATRMTLAR